MKNFFPQLKNMLNKQDPEAGFNDETTESQVLEYLAARDQKFSEDLDSVKGDNESLTDSMAKLVSSIEVLAGNATAQETKLSELETKLNGKLDALAASLSTTTEDGDESPFKAEGQKDKTVFKIGSRVDQIVKTLGVVVDN